MKTLTGVVIPTLGSFCLLTPEYAQVQQPSVVLAAHPERAAAIESRVKPLAGKLEKLGLRAPTGQVVR
jgi:hypothetical protein